MKKTIFFEKDGKYYKATEGASLENLTDKKRIGVSVQEIVERDNGKYGILFFGTHVHWGKQLEVQSIDDPNL